MEPSKSTLDPNIPVVPEFVEWNNEINEKVQKLIKEDFPRKILALNSLLKEEYFDEKYIKEVIQEIIIPQSGDGLRNDSHLNKNSACLKDDTATTTTIKGKEIIAASIESSESQEETDHKQANKATVPENAKIKIITNMVKSKIYELTDDAQLIKLWVKLLIPRIEDGHTHAVSIQDTISRELGYSIDANKYSNIIRGYNVVRAEIVMKIDEYPFIEDYRVELAEIDERQWSDLKYIMMRIRNNYINLYCTMTKNWEQLISPRSTNINLIEKSFDCLDLH